MNEVDYSAVVKSGSELWLGWNFCVVGMTYV